jgi:competence protein ComEA
MDSIVTRLRQQPLVLLGIAVALVGVGIFVAGWRDDAEPPVDVLAFDAVAEPAPTVAPAGVAPATAPTEEPMPASAAAADVVAYVSGAVMAPDVYRLPALARVKDLVLAAGGFAPEADPAVVNLAAPLSDGAHIHIPRVGEPVAAVGASPASPGDARGMIDLNHASAAELDALPGIGPAIAERIIAYRDANGPFRELGDLQRVDGIGNALIERIAPLVIIGP